MSYRAGIIEQSLGSASGGSFDQGLAFKGLKDSQFGEDEKVRLLGQDCLGNEDLTEVILDIGVSVHIIEQSLVQF